MKQPNINQTFFNNFSPYIPQFSVSYIHILFASYNSQILRINFSDANGKKKSKLRNRRFGNDDFATLEYSFTKSREKKCEVVTKSRGKKCKKSQKVVQENVKTFRCLAR
ncbi:MAG: hypothetical protein II852_18385 [Bacteroidales bacterium]|nr:hypothetical protein [Bacteroidales bacterium]